MSPAGSPADLDRRFYAAVVDRVVGWGLLALAAWLAVFLGFSEDRIVVGVAIVVAGVLLVWVGTALVVGLTGTSPGRSVTSLRVVDDAGSPIGVSAALRRGLVLGLLTLPTAGIGLASLASTVALDPSGRRRGWHDRLVGSTVVDVRPAPLPAETEPVGPKPVVNLTAMRLRPEPVSEPVAEPTSVPEREPATPRPAAATVGAATVRRTATRTSAWSVSFDSGEAFDVTGLVLVGRAPQARTGEAPERLVPLGSADMSISKTHAHLEISPADGALVVMDRGSTNGSVLLRGEIARDLPPDRPTALLAGDRVRIGDRVMSVRRTIQPDDEENR